MVLDWLKRLVAPPPTFERLADVVPGPARLEGTVRASGSELLKSPLRGSPCVAFYYRAFYQAAARGRYVDRVVKEEEVYLPSFLLEMEGGNLRVVPPRSGSMDASEHRALHARGFPGFTAEEQAVCPGMRVRLHGTVRTDAEGPYLRLRQIDLLLAGGKGGRRRGPGKRRRRE